MTLPVLTVVTDGADWEAALVAAWGSGSGGVTVVRRCTGAADLLAVASTGVAVAAVVPTDLPHLDRPLLAQLASVGVGVVGVTDPDDGAGRDRLRALGVGHVLPTDAAPTAVAAALRSAAAAQSTHGAGRPRRRDPVLPVGPAPPGAPEEARAGSASGWPSRSGGQPPPSVARSRLTGRGTGHVPRAPVHAGPPGGPRHPAPAARPPSATTAPRPDRAPASLPTEATPGRVVAVWGPTGAPGRTTVAIGVADEAARLGVPTLLVDADTYGGAVAQLLGLLDEASGLASAARLADTGRLDRTSLAALARTIPPRLRVLTGLSRPDRWPEVGPDAMTDVLDQARTLCPLTVVDCGFCLEQDEELVFDTAAPRRNGATLATLEAADTVLAVGAADPVGLQRLIRGLASLRELAPSVEPEVVVNRVRRGPVPGDPGTQVAAALERFAGVRGVRSLPYDRAAADRALAEGRTLAEVAEKSRLRTALIELATSVSVQDR